MHWILWGAAFAGATTPALPLVSSTEPQIGPEQPGQPIGPGEYHSVVDDSSDDSVPLPNKPTYRATPQGDVLVAPASGNPYFLSFAGGAYFPPASEVIDPELDRALRANYLDGRPTNQTYAFVMFSRKITRDRIQALESLGLRVLEFHPFYCMKVAVSADTVSRVAALDFVRWIGVPRAAQKIHPAMSAAVASLRDGDLIDAYVNVFDSDLNDASTSAPFGAIETGGPKAIGVVAATDENGPKLVQSNGWQHKALAALGCDVRSWEESPRAFRVRLHPTQLAALAALDFVQFIEPRGEPKLAHDESMPMVNMDRGRYSYDGGVSGAAVVGEADSGVDYAHSGLTGFYWWGNNLTGGGEGVSSDLCEHGSHVNGTIRGTTAVNASYEGAASGLAQLPTTRFFITKIFSGIGCGFGGATMSQIVSTFNHSVIDASFNTTQRPQVINNSWGTPGGPFFGSEADCRTLDNDIYVNHQLYCFAAGNQGSGGKTILMEASTKNVLTVGSVNDYSSALGLPGVVSSFSSRGPTADLRWKPNLCAPGDDITSVDANSGTGYKSLQGTSMATPHVTGLAAELCDQSAFFRWNPTSLSAVLMATAMTRNNQLLTTPSTVSTDHLNQYGTGRIEAYKAHFTGSQLAQYYYGWDQGTTGYNYVDVPILAGATRITVCLNYHEVAASAGAGSALVNDLDLYIDAPPIQAGGNTGDYVVQQSTRDNTEIRSLDNPPAGTWRMKVYSQSCTSVTHVGLAVSIIYGSTTPNTSLNLTQSKVYLQPNQNVDITATVSNPDYVASAVYLDSTSIGDTLQASSTTLYPFVQTNLMNNKQFGRDVLLGDIIYGTSRTEKWTTRWATEGLKGWRVEAFSDNASYETDSLLFYVDGTAPGVVTNLTSPSHQPGVWSNNPNFVANWTAATDNLSGIAGYAIPAGTSSPQLPAPFANYGNVTTFSASSGDTTGTYFNIRAVDNSGNWSGGYATWGPLLIDLEQPNYLTGLTSTTHLPNVQSCNDHITMQWDPETDVGPSGIAGFNSVWDHIPDTDPQPGINIFGNVTSANFVLASDPQPWYFHIAPVDNAGNIQNHYNAGPYFINTSPVSGYCTPKVNSLGCTPLITFSGTPSMANSTLHLAASQVLNNKNGLLFFGTQSASTPFQGGVLCVKPPIKRTGVQSTHGNAPPNDCSGTMDFAWTSAEFAANGLAIGQTVYNQYWSRDPNSPSTTSLTAGVQFTICQ